MAVVTALELDEFIAARVAARNADGAHRGLRTGVDHTHHLGGGVGGGNLFRHLNFELCRQAVAQTAINGLERAVLQKLGRVAEEHRSPGADKINVFIAVLVPNAVPLRPRGKDRRHADGAERADRRIDAARHQSAGARVGFSGSCTDHTVPSFSFFAISSAKYVMISFAPARLMARSDS